MKREKGDRKGGRMSLCRRIVYGQKSPGHVKAIIFYDSYYSECIFVLTC